MSQRGKSEHGSVVAPSAGEEILRKSSRGIEDDEAFTELNHDILDVIKIGLLI